MIKTVAKTIGTIGLCVSAVFCAHTFGETANQSFPYHGSFPKPYEQHKHSDNSWGSPLLRPRLSISVSEQLIRVGEEVTIQWKSHFSPRGVLMLPEWKRYKKNGSLKVTPTETTRYTFLASNIFGITSEEVVIEVEHEPEDAQPPSTPIISSIYSAGQNVGLDWAPSRDNATPLSELRYQVYYSTEADPDSRVLGGEVIGETSYLMENLGPDLEIWTFVEAIDENGNVSPLSAPASIRTGSANVVLKPELTIIDLESEGLSYTFDGVSRLTTPLSSYELRPNDILILGEPHYMTVKVTAVINNIDHQEAEVVEISSFEIIEEGDFHFKLNFNEILDDQLNTSLIPSNRTLTVTPA